MKVLVLVAHPNLATSRVNKAWSEAFERHENVTVRDLYKLYPDMDIDILEEQAVLLAHDRIVLQFPLYWYSSPAVLKHWLDLVLQPGFAYAVGGDKLRGKEFVICTSVGSTEDNYRAGGHNNYSVDELLRPFQQSVAYIRGRYISPFCFFRALVASDEEIAASIPRLIAYVLDPDINPERDHEKFIIDTLSAMYNRAEDELV